MNELLKKLLNASGISGYEAEVSALMAAELKKSCDEVRIDNCGNVIARKGSSGPKVMLAAHMDEIGLVVKHISAQGFLHFVKVGGIDDRILPGQRVVVKAKKESITGIIGAKPPHLQKEEDRKRPVRYEDMFIDIGCPSRAEAEKRLALADPVIFEPNAGEFSKDLFFGKAVDNRVGCFALLEVMKRLKAKAQVYAVATVQEEVGLKGARTAAFGIEPEYAIALDTTVAGDTPQTSEKESALKLGAGVAITMIEAAGRGLIVHAKMKDLFLQTAVKNKIAYQLDVLEGGMTDGAIISLNRDGVLTGTLSIPSRYVHSPSGVFSRTDLEAAVQLCVACVERIGAGQVK